MPYRPSPALRPSVEDRPLDVIVVGSGAGGLAAAVSAAHQGLNVLVLEKERLLGGTTAWSGGWMWMPRNPLAVQAGIVEDIERPLNYLRHELGARFDEATARHYLEQAPLAVDFFRRHTALQFVDGNAIPDFHGRTPDAALGGRSVCAAPFDGCRLGPALRDLAPPLPETTVWGLGIAAGVEMRHFFNALSKPGSLLYVARRLAGLAWDLLRHGRSMRLVNGNALAAGLLRSALDLGVRYRTGHAVVELLREGTAKDARATGVRVQTAQGERIFRARAGVVLACGGFPHDDARKAQWLPHAPTGQEHKSAAAWGNTGDGLRLGAGVGGALAEGFAQGAALAPVSLVPRAGVPGGFTHFPHLIERAKPGLIAVTAQGQRFVNEADSYYDFISALLRAAPAGQPAQAWLLCDQAFIRRYGLGAVKPAPFSLQPWQANGYLVSAPTWPELAQRCGIAGGALERTVAAYNAMAQSGVNADFHKGETPYNRIQGDAAFATERGWPNPCVAPLLRPPFHALRVVVGSLGTFAGLQTDGDARVLDGQGHVVEGLYAVGNDKHSIFAGHYPSGGITLGPALTFGWLAGRDVAQQR